MIDHVQGLGSTRGGVVRGYIPKVLGIDQKESNINFSQNDGQQNMTKEKIFDKFLPAEEEQYDIEAGGVSKSVNLSIDSSNFYGS